MVWHLIAAIFAGLAAAGIGLTLRVISGKRLPRWIVPVFAGLGMLGYQIHYEYNWQNFKQQQLQEISPSAEMVSSEQGGAFWRPWTYFFPITKAFTVVEREKRVVRPVDDERSVAFLLYRFEKEWVVQVTRQAYLMNCTTRELLPLDGESRVPRVSELRRVDISADLYRAVCTES